MIVNTTVPDFFKPTPTPSTTPSASPTNTATASETATMTASSSITGSAGASRSSAPSKDNPGLLARIQLVFPNMTLAHLMGDNTLSDAQVLGDGKKPSDQTVAILDGLKQDISDLTGVVSKLSINEGFPT
jgi:hypothetical protein